MSEYSPYSPEWSDNQPYDRHLQGMLKGDRLEVTYDYDGQDVTQSMMLQNIVCDIRVPRISLMTFASAAEQIRILGSIDSCLPQVEHMEALLFDLQMWLPRKNAISLLDHSLDPLKIDGVCMEPGKVLVPGSRLLLESRAIRGTIPRHSYRLTQPLRKIEVFPAYRPFE